MKNWISKLEEDDIISIEDCDNGKVIKARVTSVTKTRVTTNPASERCGVKFSRTQGHEIGGSQYRLVDLSEKEFASLVEQREINRIRRFVKEVPLGGLSLETLRQIEALVNDSEK